MLKENKEWLLTDSNLKEKQGKKMKVAGSAETQGMCCSYNK